MTSQTTSRTEPTQARGTVAARLAVLVLVPVASLLVAVSVVVFEAWSDTRRADALQRATQVATHVGELAHRTQDERGMSVYHLANNLGPIGDDLLSSRAELDAVLEVVRIDAGSNDVDPILRQSLTTVLSYYDDLAVIRRQVEAHTIDADATVATYSRGVDASIEALEALLPLASDAHATRQVTSYLDLLEVAEQAARQRALIGRLAAAGTMSDTDLGQVNRLAGRREGFIQNFLVTADQALRDRWAQAEGSAAFTEADHLEAALTDDRTLPAGDEWWNKATARLQAVHEVRRATGDAILADAAANRSAAARTVALTLAGAAALLTVVGLAAMLVSRGITRPLRLDSSLIASASEQLAAVSTQMTASAADAADLAQAAAHSSGEVSASIHTVASASAQLTASIDDVARAAGEAAAIAADGALLARDASSIVASLGESSSRIGGVVALISSIAKQTNLLALNATIEAARAGAAGKGFAVVASEVKDLSHQVTKATEEISGQVAGIQADAQAAGNAISQVAKVITRVNETQETIASVVREQMKATSEIDHNVHRTAMRADEITGTIDALASGAEEFSRCAVDTRGAAGDLNRAAKELGALVGTALP